MPRLSARDRVDPEIPMNVAQVAAEIMKREGCEYLLAYPLNPLTESCAAAGIRPIIVRQERIGVHMADAISRTTSGEKVGVFCQQAGPGVENSFGAVAQAWSEGVPLVVIPGGSARAMSWVRPNFNATLNFQHITKSCEQITTAAQIVPAMRRAFTQARNGRPGPVLIEVPGDMWNEEVPGQLDYVATKRFLSAPDHATVDAAAAALIAAKRPLIYAGQGVHYAQAWDELRRVAELLEAPVTTSLEGKSAFPETHPLSLGSGGRSVPQPVHEFLQRADVIFGIGCSFATTNYAVPMPPGKVLIHATLDPADLNKDVPADHVLLGDAGLTLDAVLAAVKERVRTPRREQAAKTAAEITAVRGPWLERWMPKLTSGEVPLSPYRVIWDLLHTVDVPNTIITHDAGSPRDQLSPFWVTEAPLSYIGWGKTTQLGYGLGLAMGAKLAQPEKLCINVWGDAAIGFTGMDFETAARERIPILSVLFNNFSMAIELPIMQVATAKYRSTDISGNYAALAQALGGHGERVTEPSQIVPAIQRAVRKTQEGTPALLEFITAKEIEYSIFK